MRGSARWRVELPPMARALTVQLPAVWVVVGAVAGVGAVAVAVNHRADPLVSLLLPVAVICYGVLAAVDIAEQRLPNRLTVPLAVATVLLVAVGGSVRSGPAAALGAVAVGLAFSLVLALMRFGMGDVKMAFTVGTIAGWLGRDAVVTTALVGALSGAAVALVLIVIHRRRDVAFSFGPFLAIGSVAGMLAAGP